MRASYIFSILFFNSFFSQINDSSIVTLEELDFDKESEVRIIEYKKTLSRNNLTYLHNASFKILYSSGDPLTGKITYKRNDLSIKDIKFDKSLSEDKKSIIYKVFSQIYRLGNTYYKYSINTDKISENFYCKNNENNKWLFIVKKKLKKQYNIDMANKLNFNVLLDDNGNIKNITTYLDNSNVFVKNNKYNTSHNIRMDFIPYKDDIIINSINGFVIDASGNNKIEFEMKFH